MQTRTPDAPSMMPSGQCPISVRHRYPSVLFKQQHTQRQQCKFQLRLWAMASSMIRTMATVTARYLLLLPTTTHSAITMQIRTPAMHRGSLHYGRLRYLSVLLQQQHADRKQCKLELRYEFGCDCYGMASASLCPHPTTTC